MIAGLKTLSSKSARGFANRAEAPATAAIEAVVVAICAEGRYCSTILISSYNSTHIHVPCCVFCNSWPITFSFSLGPTAPIRRDVGPGQSGFSLPALGIVGVSGVSISGSGGGATGGALLS